MTRLELEVDDFVYASRSMYDDVAEPLRASFGRLTDRLSGLGAMAGGDPGGMHWAESYDQASASALSAMQQMVNGCYRLSSMFGRSGLNCVEGEAASTPLTIRTAITAEIQRIPPESSTGPAPALPSAAGGSGDAPTGWGLVQHLVGYVWPNGHQDRLHTAAQAWTASADALLAAFGPTVLAPTGFDVDRLPEGPDMHAVCRAMGRRLEDLAGLHRSLAQACTDLARHVDDCHSRVKSELVSLVEWSAGTQVLGGIASVFSFGAAEAPTQAAEAAEVLATAGRITVLIEKFIALARSVGQTVGDLVARADKIAGELVGLNDARLTAAVVTQVQALPGALTVRELVATRRIVIGSKNLLPHVFTPKKFDPELLRGMNPRELRAGIPKSWERRPATDGDGMVFVDPAHRGRQIRIMKAYPPGSRPDPLTSGPYVLVSQSAKKVKVPLMGNPTL